VTAIGGRGWVDSVEMKKKEAFQFNLFAAYIII
jgi:hypothetical protein